MKHPVELAAQFIRRGDFVHANDVLRDEYGVELGHPAQIGYCSFDPENLALVLERTARVFGCLTHTEEGIYLTVVGEKEVIDKLEEVRLVALSDEYGYKNALSEVDITSVDKKWQEDYVEGFFDGLIGNFDLGSFSKNPHVLGILDGADSMKRYVKANE